MEFLHYMALLQMQFEQTQQPEGYVLDLSFQCRNLENMIETQCYQLILYYKDPQGIFFEYDRTDLLKGSPNLVFLKTIKTNFMFEKKQPIKLELICHSTKRLISQCQTNLGQIVGGKGQMLLFPMVDLFGQKNGMALIKAEKYSKQTQHIFMEIQCTALKNQSFLGWFKTDSFVVISRSKENSVLLQTEVVYGTQNPLFKNIKVAFDTICKSDPFNPLLGQGTYNQILKLVFDFNGGKKPLLIGEWNFTVYQVNDQKVRKFELHRNGRLVGEVTFTKFQFDPSYLFCEYIRSGMELALIIAIDMTKSNKDPHLKESLHSIHPESKSQYLEAIKAVSEVLLNYDHDKHVPVFGFGGKPRMPNLTTEDTLHCFPLSGDPYNPDVEGLDAIISLYQKAVTMVDFDGPTYFNQVIEQTMMVAQEELDTKGNQYFILLILTDGLYHDRSSTKRSIVKASHLPMSIIIVGIGNEDFSGMIELDGDQGLVDDAGNHAQRDLVQFVPFRQFENNGEALAQAVLEELPTQVVEFIELNSLSKLPK